MKLIERLPRASFRIHTRLTLALVVLVTLVVFSSARVLIEQARERGDRELEERATRVADLLSRSLSEPMWNVDSSAIDSQLAALSRCPEIVQMQVTAGHFGVVVSRTNGSELPSAEDRIVRVRPIEYEPSGEASKRTIGEIRVVLTRAVAQEAIDRTRNAILAIMSLVVSIIGVATYFVLTRHVSGPIRRLEAMVDRIAGGDLDARCLIEADNEIGRLAARVNTMAERLRESTASLRASERKYRSIFENSLEGIFRLDESGHLEEANPALARLLGYREFSELVRGKGADANPRLFMPAQTRQLFSLLRAQGEIAGLELQLKRSDGTPVWVLLNARGVSADGSGKLFLEGLLTDITSRRYALDSLRSHRDQLAVEVRHRRRSEEETRASREQLQELSAHLEGVREDERKRIAMEIHDELGQLLTALKIDVSLIAMQLTPDSAAFHKAHEMRELVDRTIRIVRSLVNQLRPAALNFGLASALEWLAVDFGRRSSISCQFSSVGAEPDLTEERATAMFRIAQESLTNVLRHAGATSVEVTLKNMDSALELVVLDNGRGFNTKAARDEHSYGLLGMRERARLIGAQLKINSRPDGGTAVHLRVAVSADSGHIAHANGTGVNE